MKNVNFEKIKSLSQITALLAFGGCLVYRVACGSIEDAMSMAVDHDHDPADTSNTIVIEDPNSVYSVTEEFIRTPTLRTLEDKFYYKDNRHFLTVISETKDKSTGYIQDIFALRPHPGDDVDGWGSTLYCQAFFPGATLQHTEHPIIFTVKTDSIRVEASGKISLRACVKSPC